MRRRVAWLIILGACLVGSARADTPWTANQNAQSIYRLKNLLAPATAGEPATLGILNPGGSPCLLASPGSLGVPVCGSPAILFTPDAPLVFGGGGGTHLQLTLDGTSVGVSGGALQRLALTGAVTSAPGSGTTFFGTFAAYSALVNATGSTSVPSPLAAGSDGLVLGRFASALTWHQLVEGDITNLTTDLAALVPLTRTLTMSGPLTCDGGGSCTLAANRTLGIALTGPSVLGKATSGTGSAAAITSSSSGDALWNNSGTVAWAPYPYSALSGAPVIPSTVATWGRTGARVFCVDGGAGNDANAGFADSADTTQANVQTATASCGAAAKQTWAGVTSIIPPIGQQRTAYVVIAAGTYVEPADLIDRAKGYSLIVVRGTATNSTAGSTAFSGSTNDLTFQGATTGTGMNASGYNPTSSTTSDTVTLALVGGGSPGFAADPAKPVGLRFRWDAATATVALRNKVQMIVERTSTTTVRLDASVAFTTSDVGYIEQPGVVFAPSPSSTAAFTGVDSALAFNGIAFSAGVSASVGRYSFSFCSVGTSMVATNNGAMTFGSTANLTPFPTIGPTRIETSTTLTAGVASITANSFVTGTTFAASGISSMIFSSHNVVGTNATFTGGGGRADQSPGQQQLGATGGGGTTADKALAPRILGSLTFVSARMSVGVVNLPSTSQAFAVKLVGINDLAFQYALFGGPTTDAAFDVSQSTGSRVQLIAPWADGNNSMHITGTNGDVFGGTTATVGSQLVYGSFAGLTQNAGTMILPNGDHWITATGTSATSGAITYAYATTVSTTVYAANRTGADTTVDVNGFGTLVRFGPNGFSGTDRIEIAPAQADTLAHASGGIGQAVGSIKDGKAGWVVVSSGSFSFVGSDVTSGGYGAGLLYLSDTGAGKVTHTPPAPPSIVLPVGWAIGEATAILLPNNQPIYNQTWQNGASTLTQRTVAHADGTTIVASDVASPNYWTNLSVGSIPESSVTGLTADLATKLADPGSNGLLARTGPGVTTNRTLTPADGSISVTNGDGVAGSPTIAISQLLAGTPAAGPILFTNVAIPSTPASGKASCYVDSTSLNWVCKNASAALNHGIQTRTATASNWIRSIADDGTTTISQPAFTDLAGSLAAGQFGPLMGDVTTSGYAATLATTGVGAGSCTNCNLTYDAKGRLTVAANGSAGGGGTVTSVGGTAPIASSGGTTPQISLNANGVTDTYLRQGGQFTVIGRSAVTTGNVADIQAAGNGDVLRVASNVLGFGTIPATSVSGLAAVATSGSAADLGSGTLSASRLPALTGDATSSAGSSATDVRHIHDNIGQSFAIGEGVGGLLDTQFLVVDGSNITTVAPNYQFVYGNGTLRTARPSLNFLSSLTAMDNSGTGRTDVDLAATGPGAGTYGSSGSAIEQITLDAKGRVTGLTTSAPVAHSRQANLTFSMNLLSSFMHASTYALPGGMWTGSPSGYYYPLGQARATAIIECETFTNSAGSGSWSLTLYKNGVATSAALTVAVGATGYSGTAITTISGAAGDIYALYYDGSGVTSAVQLQTYCNVTFDTNN